jgi:hypothetical protein
MYLEVEDWGVELTFVPDDQPWGGNVTLGKAKLYARVVKAGTGAGVGGRRPGLRLSSND